MTVQFGSVGAPLTAGAIATALGFTLSGTAGQTYTFPAASATIATLGANTFTALQTITQASANAGITASTGYSLTGSDATSMISYAGTLNTSGVVNVISVAITNTAAGAGSNALQILGGAAAATNLFKIDMSGNATLAGNLTSAATSLIISSASKVFVNNNAYLGGSTSSTAGVAGTSFGLAMRSDSAIYMASTANTDGTADTGLSRVSAGVIGIGTGGAGSVAGSLQLTALTASGVVFNTASTTNYLGTTTSAADTMVSTPSPALTAYTTGAVYFAKSGFTNATTTPTINISGLGAKTIVKRAATALAAGDYVTNMIMILAYDGTNMELLNPVAN